MPRNTESIASPFCLVFKKNRQVKTAQHLSRRKFRDNLLDIDADWRGAVVLSRKYGFYLLICLHTALKMLEIHAGISPLFALSANKLAKYKLLCTLAVLARCSLDFEKADWLSPINFEKSKMCFDNTARACLCDNTIALKEKSSKLDKNIKRETKRFDSLYPWHSNHARTRFLFADSPLNVVKNARNTQSIPVLFA